MVTSLESVLKMHWLGFRAFIRHPRSVIKCATLLVMLVEAIAILIAQATHFRVTRVLRPIFLYNSYYCSGLRRYLRQVSDQSAIYMPISTCVFTTDRQVLQSVLPALEIILLLLFVILFFSVLGFFLFDSVPNDTNFTTLWQSFISLFILLTTAK